MNNQKRIKNKTKKHLTNMHKIVTINRMVKKLFLSCNMYKMNKGFLLFSDTAVDKRKFHYPKNPIQVHNVDIDQISDF